MTEKDIRRERERERETEREIRRERDKHIYHLPLQYYTLPEISDDTAKLDMWARLYSQTVNTNLCPYFEWWGWTLTAETKDACSKLPAWKVEALSRFAGKTYLKILCKSKNILF